MSGCFSFFLFGFFLCFIFLVGFIFGASLVYSLGISLVTVLPPTF